MSHDGATRAINTLQYKKVSAFDTVLAVSRAASLLLGRQLPAAAVGGRCSRCA